MIDIRPTLEAADQDGANNVFMAFQHAANGLNVATVWWAFAMIQAHLLASAPPGVQLEMAERLAALCEIALPAAMGLTVNQEQ